MGRLCGGAHEISGIPVPLWLHGWMVGGFMGWMGFGVGGGGVGGDVGSGWCVCGGSGQVSSACGGVFMVGWVVCLWWWGVLVRSRVGGCWCVGWICITHIWSLTLFPTGILIFQGVATELNFFDENERLKI